MNFLQFDLFEKLFAPPVASKTPVAPKVRGVQLESQFLHYQLLRSKRRSIGFLITDNGLRITAPRWVGIKEIEAAIVSKQRWILSKLREQQERPAVPVADTTLWQAGATVPLLGQPVQIQFGDPGHFDAETATLFLNLPSDASPALCKKHVHASLMKQARRNFSERLPHFAQLLGVSYHSFTLTSANTRWGSCNSAGKIRLNWRLIHFNQHLIDYVIAHELAHLHEMNHSVRFWAKVEQVFPDYLAARHELKLLGLKSLPEF